MNVVTPRAHFDAARWIFSTTQSTLAFRRDKQKRKKKRSGYTRKSSFWKKNISLGVCFKYSQRAVFPFRKKTPETRVIFNVGWFEILSLNERSMQKRDPILSKTNRRKKELQPPICPLKDGTLLQIKIHCAPMNRQCKRDPILSKTKRRKKELQPPFCPLKDRTLLQIKIHCCRTSSQQKSLEHRINQSCNHYLLFSYAQQPKQMKEQAPCTYFVSRDVRSKSDNQGPVLN